MGIPSLASVSYDRSLCELSSKVKGLQGRASCSVLRLLQGFSRVDPTRLDFYINKSPGRRRAVGSLRDGNAARGGKQHFVLEEVVFCKEVVGTFTNATGIHTTFTYLYAILGGVRMSVSISHVGWNVFRSLLRYLLNFANYGPL